MKRSWLRNTLLVGAFACAAYGTAGMIPGAFGYERVKTADERSVPVTKKENIDEKRTYDKAVQRGDGSWHVARRAITDALEQRDQLMEKYRKDGYAVAAPKLLVAGVEITKLNNDAINRVAHALPLDERNADAYFCPSQYKHDTGCGEQHILYGKKGSPNTVNADISLAFGATKELKTIIPAQYQTMPRTNPGWATATAFLAAAGLGGAAYAYSRRPDEEQVVATPSEVPGEQTVLIGRRRLKERLPRLEDTVYRKAGTEEPAQEPMPVPAGSDDTPRWRRAMQGLRNPAGWGAALGAYLPRRRADDPEQRRQSHSRMLTILGEGDQPAQPVAEDSGQPADEALGERTVYKKAHAAGKRTNT